MRKTRRKYGSTRSFNKLLGFPSNWRDFSISLESTTFLKKGPGAPFRLKPAVPRVTMPLSGCEFEEADDEHTNA